MSAGLVDHIRTVHLTLLLTSLAVFVATQLSEDDTLAAAQRDLTAIRGLRSSWPSDFIEKAAEQVVAARVHQEGLKDRLYRVSAGSFSPDRQHLVLPLKADAWTMVSNRARPGTDWKTGQSIERQNMRTGPPYYLRDWMQMWDQLVELELFVPFQVKTAIVTVMRPTDRALRRQEYQPLFASLTSSVRAPRSLFYNAQSPQQLAGVRLNALKRGHARLAVRVRECLPGRGTSRCSTANHQSAL